MSKMGFNQSQSSFFGEQAAPVRANQYTQSADTADHVPAATQKLNMSMFGTAANPPSVRNIAQPQFMNTFGNQVNMMQSSMGASRTSRSSIVMKAGATVTGDTKQDVKENHMDKVFLQQKYDNADHMDPDLHYTGLKYTEELMKNAKLLSAPGKGILASDESNGTCGNRF